MLFHRAAKTILATASPADLPARSNTEQLPLPRSSSSSFSVRYLDPPSHTFPEGAPDEETDLGSVTVLVLRSVTYKVTTTVVVGSASLDFSRTALDCTPSLEGCNTALPSSPKVPLALPTPVLEALQQISTNRCEEVRQTHLPNFLVTVSVLVYRLVPLTVALGILLVHVLSPSISVSSLNVLLSPTNTVVPSIHLVLASKISFQAPPHSPQTSQEERKWMLR
jgi:hypothetical protein